MTVLGAIGSWTNSYTVGGSLEYTGEETYVELGFAKIDVPAGVFTDAYYVTNTYSQEPIDAGGGGGIGGLFQGLFGGVFGGLIGFGDDGTEPIEAWSEYYYVEGLGLVYQITTDVDTCARPPVVAPMVPAWTTDRVSGFLELYVSPEDVAPSGAAALPIDNIARIPVELDVDGRTVGLLEPHALGVVRNVAPGPYTLGYRFPSGFVRSVVVEAR